MPSRRTHRCGLKAPCESHPFRGQLVDVWRPRLSAVATNVAKSAVIRDNENHVGLELGFREKTARKTKKDRATKQLGVHARQCVGFLRRSKKFSSPWIAPANFPLTNQFLDFLATGLRELLESVAAWNYFTQILTLAKVCCGRRVDEAVCSGAL